MAQLTINGEAREVGEFKAFKGMLAGEILTEADAVYREVMTKVGEVRQQWMDSHVEVLPRATARQRYGPRVIHDKIVDPETDQVIKLEPVIVGGTVTLLEGGARHVEDGAPMIGPDPLGHLTEADWEASGQVLRIPEEPSQEELFLAMIPVVFKLARRQVLRVIALTLTTNAELQTWDENEGLDYDTICDRLDEQAKKLQHSASFPELIRITTAVFEIIRQQVQDPFAEARAQGARTLELMRGGPVTAEVPLQPMTVDPAPDSTPPSSASSTPSDSGTDGHLMSPSTASPGDVPPG